MKNCYVKSYNWIGRYWDYEDAYITRNDDGTWHVEYDSRMNKYESDMSEEDAQKVVDRMRRNYEQSKEPQFARYSMTEVTHENIDEFIVKMMSYYDWYTDYIESGSQQAAAERHNEMLLQRAERFKHSVEIERRAA